MSGRMAIKKACVRCGVITLETVESPNLPEGFSVGEMHGWHLCKTCEPNQVEHTVRVTKVSPYRPIRFEP